MAAPTRLVRTEIQEQDDVARETASQSRHHLRSAGAAAEPTLLHLAGEADIGAVQRIFDEARAAATRGGEISIHCDDATCFDLGALQLLSELRDEVQASQLEFASPQRARTEWLAGTGRDLRARPRHRNRTGCSDGID